MGDDNVDREVGLAVPKPCSSHVIAVVVALLDRAAPKSYYSQVHMVAGSRAGVKERVGSPGKFGDLICAHVRKIRRTTGTRRPTGEHPGMWNPLAKR